MPEQPSHSDIFQQIGALTGKVDALLLLMEERNKSGDRRIEALEKEVNNIRAKQETHSNRIAQAVILSVLLSILAPVGATIWAARIAAPASQHSTNIR